jgi:hypothetical protein
MANEPVQRTSGGGEATFWLWAAIIGLLALLVAWVSSSFPWW